MADRVSGAATATVTGAVLAGVVAPGGAGELTPFLVHVPVYALLMTGAAALLRDEPEGLAAAVVLVSLAGIAVEIALPLLGSTGSFVNYLSNEIGVGLGAAITLLRRRACSHAAEESDR
ncbi:MAG: hypothetical protein M0R77_03950 [Gammaproteobacteria bacterium]|nr:hypothetical protein [Gammaproteobacteria bacterium]